MDLVRYGTYQDYKRELDTELRKTAEGFVKIGYLLKVAKDTDILKESGYANVYDFAQAEYNIDKSQVSRFININDRFSEGGYSDRLKEQFRGFGRAKLTIMLQLPDEINEELTPDFSKSEIQALKEEYDEEKKVSDLEILMEGENPEQLTMDNNLWKVLHQLGMDEPEIYVQLHESVEKGDCAVQDTLAPNGEKIYDVRIQGKGRMALSIKGVEEPVTLTSMRTAEKEYFSWKDMLHYTGRLMKPELPPEESWEKIYGREFPKKPEVAPVQQEKKPFKKENRVQKAKKPEEKKPEPQEEQIPGQDNIMNHQEYLPESMKGQENHAGEISDSEEQGRAYEDAHHGAGDHSGGEKAEPERNGEGDADTGTVPNAVPQGIQDITGDDILKPAAGAEEAAEEAAGNIWDDAAAAVAKLTLFFQNWSREEMEAGTIPAEALQKAYKNAIDVVADLGRMKNNGKKHYAQ